MRLDPRGIAAAGKVEGDDGWKIGTELAELVVRAYLGAITRQPEIDAKAEAEAGDISAISDALSPVRYFSGPCMARFVNVTDADVRPTAVDQVLRLEPPYLYETLPGYEDVMAARLTMVGKYRAELDASWQLHLGILVHGHIEWPNAPTIMFIQRIKNREDSIIGVVLERPRVNEISLSMSMGDASVTNVDVIFGHARLLDLRSSETPRGHHER